MNDSIINDTAVATMKGSNQTKVRDDNERLVLPDPILVENDATAASRAEWTFGKQATQPDSIYFFLGTFVGGGTVLNGNVFKGCRGNAGGGRD